MENPDQEEEVLPRMILIGNGNSYVKKICMLI